MIAIVDYGAGNLRSVSRALAKLGYEARVTSAPVDIGAAEAVILPGVGAAGEALQTLQSLELIEPIKQGIAEGKPFLGVCLGLQLLFTTSEEGGRQKCLDVLPGTVRRLPPSLKVPHMGWNQVSQRRPHPLFDSIPNNSYFYFVHSYYAEPSDPSVVAATTSYGIEFCSVAISDNVIATQFHPEKSGELGLRIYENFCRLALGARVAPR